MTEGSSPPGDVSYRPVDLPRPPRRLPAATPPVSPLRALAGALVAVAGVLLGIGALLWVTDAPQGSPTIQQSQSRRAVPPLASSPTATAGTSAASLPTPLAARPVAPAVAPRLPLTVLNNSRIAGLADRAADRFRAGGWPVAVTGNFRGRIAETTVYYAAGELPSALLLQRSFPGLVRVEPRFPDLPGSGLTVVLTRYFTP